MTTPEPDFESVRQHAFRVAYRMVGSAADAEDLVQDAWIRWKRADPASIDSPRAWITTVVTRLAINHLSSARARREEYVGTWLPEPIPTESAAPADQELGRDEELTLAFMLLLESLSPKERAAFLLHDVFGLPHTAVAETIGTTEAASRQLVHRARAQLRARRPRFRPGEEAVSRLLGAFRAATEAGDVERLAELLADDVVVLSDGGGKARAALRPIHGRSAVSRFVTGAVAKFVPDGVESRITRVNGAPGLVTTFEGDVLAAISIEVSDGLIQSVLIVTNPDKLRALSEAAGGP